MDLMAPTAWTTTVSSGKGTLWITTTDMLGPPGYNSMLPDPDCAEDPSALDYTHCFIGSSSSTPLTAGVAGLVLTASPALTRLQAQRLLQDTADKIDDAAGAYAPGNGYSAPVSGDRHTPGGASTHSKPCAWSLLHQTVMPGGHLPARQPARLGQHRATEQHALRCRRRHHRSLGEHGYQGRRSSYQPAPTAATFEVFSDETPVRSTATLTGSMFACAIAARRQRRCDGQAALGAVRHGAPAIAKRFLAVFPVHTLTDTSQWHPLSCAATNASTCVYRTLAYSGASVAMTSGDAARIVQFDFPAPPLTRRSQIISAYWRWWISPQDPISQASKASFFVDGITPSDNNVTHRNYVNLQRRELTRRAVPRAQSFRPADKD